MKAEQGVAEAKMKLGWMYANGKGVPQNYVMAHMFLNIAGANGDKYEAKHRGIVAKKMSSFQIEKAHDLARQWMQKHQ